MYTVYCVTIEPRIDSDFVIADTSPVRTVEKIEMVPTNP